MKYSKRVVQVLEKGRPLVYIQLGKGDVTACLWKDDFELLLSLGVSPNWQASNKHYVVCRGAKDNKKSYVARLLLDCGIGEGVKYVDGNTFNLRRENLVKVADSKACRRDRDFIIARAIADCDCIAA
jgi:hypothetical protein